MHRFGGPQRFNPYESGPRGPMPGGPWGPPHPSMYPPYYPPPPGHGHGPPMRNPEYETFDVILFIFFFVFDFKGSKISSGLDHRFGKLHTVCNFLLLFVTQVLNKSVNRC